MINFSFSLFHKFTYKSVTFKTIIELIRIINFLFIFNLNYLQKNDYQKISSITKLEDLGRIQLSKSFLMRDF